MVSGNKDIDIEKWLLLQSEVQKVQIVKVFKYFRELEIEPILIKGFAVSRLYPNDKQRISTDIDICVSESDYQKALNNLGKGEIERVNIDLHNSLRHLDTLEWDVLFNRSVLVEIGNEKIRIPAEEDHLRIMCTHWLTDGGEDKSKLWDIYYLVKNRKKDFNWDLCFQGISNRRKFWIIYTIGLAGKYLDLDLSSLPFSEEAQNLPNWLTKSIEKIWDRKHPFIPLESCFQDREMFLYQIKLRLPPNPVMATIGVEGDLDKPYIFFYQVKHFIKRAIPSIYSVLIKVIYSLRNNEQK